MPSADILSEPLAGLQTQALGLAEAAGLQPVVHALHPRAPWRWMAARTWPAPLRAVRLPSLGDGVVIGAGGVAARVAAALRRPGRPAVQVQHPRMDPARFDLIVVNRHDELTGRNVVVTRTALHRVTPARLAQAAATWEPQLVHLPRPLVAVLVGGSNGRYRFDVPVAEALGAELARMMREDRVGLALTPSRRTSPAALAALRAALEPLGAWLWDGHGENPYFGLLALADAIVVTEEFRLHGVGGLRDERARAARAAAGPLAAHCAVQPAARPGRAGARLPGAPGYVAHRTPRRHARGRRRPAPLARSLGGIMLPIQTFDARAGGNVLYKALAHPLAAEGMARLAGHLKDGPVAIYDPDGMTDALLALNPGLPRPTEVYVSDVDHLGQTRGGQPTLPLTDLPRTQARTLLIAAFDAQRIRDRIAPQTPGDLPVHTLDEARLPDQLLTNPRRYLDRLNFATNFAFFREQAGLSTRLVTANYWAGYGAKEVRLWLRLYGADGAVLAEWEEPVPNGASGIRLDSREVRARFALPEFTGQLFLHAIGVAGHDVVKYALDTYGNGGNPSLSCTHDANAWPSSRYAGLPAPKPGERVILWLQNSHAAPIPAGDVALDRMGDGDPRWRSTRPSRRSRAAPWTWRRYCPASNGPRKWNCTPGGTWSGHDTRS